MAPTEKMDQKHTAVYAPSANYIVTWAIDQLRKQTRGTTAASCCQVGRSLGTLVHWYPAVVA